MNEKQKNKTLMMESRERFRRHCVAFIIALAHLVAAYWLTLFFQSKTKTTLHAWLHIVGDRSAYFWDKFSQTFFLTSAFFYFAFVIWRMVGGAKKDYLQGVGIILFASLAVAVLRAEDAVNRSPWVPSSLPELLYNLMTERPAVMGLGMLMLAITVYIIYNIIGAVLTFDYRGGGLRIKIPGHAVYYFPVFPQTSWQPTGILLKENETIEVFMTGRVSPGAMHIDFLKDSKAHMRRFVRWQKKYYDNWEDRECLERWDKLEARAPQGWTYTDPRGYGPKDYECVARHPLYGRKNPSFPFFYVKDRLLTVTGLPHNVVVGFIKSDDEDVDEPRPASGKKHGYEWSKYENDPRFIKLSSEQYPLRVDVRRSGELYVVINDVDAARWDNTGLFLLKITKRSWF